MLMGMGYSMFNKFPFYEFPEMYLFIINTIPTIDFEMYKHNNYKIENDNTRFLRSF